MSIRYTHIPCILVIGLCWFFPWNQTAAQVSGSFQLDSVVISSLPFRQDTLLRTGQQWNVRNIKSLAGQSVADLLSQESGVFVKSYGLGSLATTAIRGGGAGHTAVIWNGLPINSPMLGQLDVSLLPLAMVDQVQLTYGGNSSLWGSGAVGGTLFLNNQLESKQEKSLEAGVTLGSFGNQSYQLSLQLGSDKVSSRTRLFHQRARNDFPYRVPGVDTMRRQPHATIQKTAWLQEFSYHLSPKSELSVHFWTQGTHRELPPFSIQPTNEATQADQSLRVATHWKQETAWGGIQARGGWFREFLIYQDPRSSIVSASDFTTLTGEIEAKGSLGNHHRLSAGIFTQSTEAFIQAYGSPVSRGEFALFISDHFHYGPWKGQLSLRQAWVANQAIPLVPNASFRFEGIPHVRLHGSIGYTYRVPTFNDLYWMPGGNPDLRPESGWNQELGLTWELGQPKHLLSIQVTAYNRNTTDWIFWTVRPGDRFYSPQNLSQVWSRGLEPRIKYRHTFSRARLQLNGGYDFTRSTHRDALSIPKVEAGEQLVYVPVHQGFGQLSIEASGWTLRYTHRYVSPVGTLNFTRLPGYQLGFASLAKDWQWEGVEGNCFLRLDNLWNTSYQVLESRPMPGRSFQFGLSLSWSAPQSIH